MKQIFKIFFQTEKTKPFLVLLCLLLASVSEVIGITTLLPAGASILGEAKAGSSGASDIINRFFVAIGVTPTFNSFLLLIGVLLLLKAVLNFGAMVYSGVTGARVTIDLRRRLIKALFNARWSYYAENSSGQLANTVSNDTGRAGDAYTYSALTISHLLQLATYAVAALVIDWQVAIAGALAGAIMIAATSKLMKGSRKSGYRLSDRQSIFTRDTIDMLNNIKPLKSMHRYDARVGDLGEQLKKLKKTIIRLHVSRQALTNGSDLLLALMVGLGAFLLHSIWQKSLNEMMVTGIIFYQMIYSLNKFQKIQNVTVQIESAYVRSMEMIANAEANHEIHRGTITPELGFGCTFKNVSFSHSERPTVTNLNFKIPAKKITVLQGPSGAGKTTIIDLLIGLNNPQTGDVYVGKNKISEINVSAWRQQIGYVPQELLLFHDSIRENISLSDPAISEADIMLALQKAGAAEFIAALPAGIDTDVGEMGGKLSGGQRQRISLARALVKNPKILILDEVTSALDPETEKEIVDNISKLQGEYTVIAITHRPAWTKIADQLYIVDAGKISPVKSKVKS